MASKSKDGHHLLELLDESGWTLTGPPGDETLDEDEETAVEPSNVAQNVDFREKTSDKEYTLREKKKNSH